MVESNGQVFLELFDPSQGQKYRRISADVAPITWNHKNGPCYYVGNSQGGPSQSNNATQSVIEGKVAEYETTSLFGTDFVYSQFDELLCT